LGIPAEVLARAHQVAVQIGRGAAELGGRICIDADEVLTGRAALLGLHAGGRISAGGATRLLASADGWCAVTLSRDEDVDTVPALLELPAAPQDPWPPLTEAAARQPAAEFVSRARLLGIPAAVMGEVSAAEPTVERLNDTRPQHLSDVLVVDLSSMWAGPLCGHLLAAAGATVVKVETRTRPDGTRSGDRRFFDWMNSQKLSYAADFDSTELRALLEVADVVIEGSRPAALVRRGLGPRQVTARPGRVWLRVTGYGTHGDCANWVAFGDDAAVAGGLVGDGPVFIGDAIADPLTGLAATRAVLEALAGGGGAIVEVSMAAVAAQYAALAPSPESRSREPRLPRLPARCAPALGADNDAVRRLIAERHATC
jgi:CoA-transferase family III